MNFHGKPIRARLIRDVSETHQGFTAGDWARLDDDAEDCTGVQYTEMLSPQQPHSTNQSHPTSLWSSRDRCGVNTAMALPLRCTPLLTLMLSCPDIETRWYLSFIFGQERFATLRGKINSWRIGDMQCRDGVCVFSSNLCNIRQNCQVICMSLCVKLSWLLAPIVPNA